MVILFLCDLYISAINDYKICVKFKCTQQNYTESNTIHISHAYVVIVMVS